MATNQRAGFSSVAGAMWPCSLPRRGVFRWRSRVCWWLPADLPQLILPPCMSLWLPSHVPLPCCLSGMGFSWFCPQHGIDLVHIPPVTAVRSGLSIILLYAPGFEKKGRPSLRGGQRTRYQPGPARSHIYTVQLRALPALHRSRHIQLIYPPDNVGVPMFSFSATESSFPEFPEFNFNSVQDNWLP